MFQNAKDRRAREEEMIRQQEMLEAMRQAVACVADSSSGAQSTLEEMEENQESLNETLKQAVAMVHKLQEDTSAQGREEVWIRQQLGEFCQRLQEREAVCGQSLEHVEEQQQNLRELAVAGLEASEPIQSLHEWADHLGGRLEEALEQVKAMDAQGRSMSVLSLNSAIEAGRMGEAGRKFVMALDEVQSCAGEYRKAAERLGQEVLKMQEGLGEALERLNQLEELKERSQRGMETVTQRLEESLVQLKGCGQNVWEEQPEIGGQEAGSGSLKELYGHWEQAAEGRDGQAEGCGQILRQIEAAEESRRKEQQLLEQLKGRQQQVKDAIKERMEWG